MGTTIKLVLILTTISSILFSDALNVTFFDTNGKEYNLYELLDTGHYILVQHADAW